MLVVPLREEGLDDSSSHRVHGQLWDQLKVLRTVKDKQQRETFYFERSPAHCEG